jgi:hypothetical protein
VAHKVRIPGPNGQQVEGTEVGFRSSAEHWNEYLLDDGTVLRFKSVVVAVYRIDGQFDEAGDPSYFLKSQNVVNVSAPENLRKDPE